MAPTRPTTLDGMREALGRFATSEGVERGLAIQPDPTDIFISPYAKCGTTWMQQIVHGLRTGGDMSFDEITAAVPWLELAHDLGLDLAAPQAARPRAFKSHLGWDQIPKGARYICVFRDPVDAMLSLYRFFDGWFFETGAIPLAEFAHYYLDRAGGDTWWDHAASWWRQRDREDVLLFTFEDMKADLPAVVNRVADFMRIPPGSPARAVAAAQADYAFMKAHDRQFDDHLVRAARDAACSLPPGGVVTKVDKGKTGQGAPLVTPAIRAAFAARWRETMTAEFGLADYGALRDSLGKARKGG